LQDERSKEIMRELAKLNNQDPRVALFDKTGRRQGTKRGTRDWGAAGKTSAEVS
jgi:hypothetical protein